MYPSCFIFFFFFNDTATTEIYTLSLHDALPISSRCGARSEGRSRRIRWPSWMRSEEHTSELQSRRDLVCRLLLEKKKKKGCVSNVDNHRRKLWVADARRCDGKLFLTQAVVSSLFFFFFNDTATTEIYTLSYTTLFR